MNEAVEIIEEEPSEIPEQVCSECREKKEAWSHDRRNRSGHFFSLAEPTIADRRLRSIRRVKKPVIPREEDARPCTHQDCDKSKNLGTHSGRGSHPYAPLEVSNELIADSIERAFRSIKYRTEIRKLEISPRYADDGPEELFEASVNVQASVVFPTRTSVRFFRGAATSERAGKPPKEEDARPCDHDGCGKSRLTGSHRGRHSHPYKPPEVNQGVITAVFERAVRLIPHDTVIRSIEIAPKYVWYQFDRDLVEAVVCLSLTILFPKSKPEEAE